MRWWVPLVIVLSLSACGDGDQGTAVTPTPGEGGPSAHAAASGAQDDTDGGRPAPPGDVAPRERADAPGGKNAAGREKPPLAATPSGPGEIAGRVLDPSSGPQAGAVVTVYAAVHSEGAVAPADSRDDDWRPAGSSKSAPDGAFRVSGVPVDGPVIVAIAHGRFCAAAVRVDRVRPNGVTRLGDVTLIDGARRPCVVHDSREQPVAGATIRVLGPAGVPPIPRAVAAALWPPAVTDEAGRLRLARLPNGAHRVTVERDGFQPVAIAGLRFGSDREPFVFTLKPGYSLAGVVIAPSGDAIPGARVVFTPKTDAPKPGRVRGTGAPRAGVRVASADERGRFRFKDVAGGAFTLSVSGEDFVTRRLAFGAFPADDTPVRVILSRGVVFRGRVVAADTKGPISRFRLRLLRAGAEDQPDAAAIEVARAFATERSADGAFELTAIQPGEWWVELRAEDRALALRPVTVRASDPAVTFEMTRSETLTAFVVDRLTGRPVEGARVRVEPRAGSMAPATESESRRSPDANPVASGYAVAETSSDRDGRVELVSLPAFKLQMSVEADTHLGATQMIVLDEPVEAARRTQSPLLFSLRRGGRLVGRVSDHRLRPRRGVAVSVAPVSVNAVSVDAVSGGGAARSLTVVTDVDGIYRVGGLPGGLYTVAPAIDEERPAAGPTTVEVREGFTSRSDLTPASRSVCVGTARRGEEPVADLMVTLDEGEGQTAWQGVPWRVWSKPSGIFTILGVPPGHHRISATTATGLRIHDDRLDVARASTERLIVPVPSGSIDGLVEAKITGRALEDVRVWLVPDGKARPGPFPPIACGVRPDRSGRAGAFTIDRVPAGRYTLFAWRPGYALSRIDGIRVRADEPVGPFTVRLDGGATLEGTVRDGASYDTNRRLDALVRLLSRDGKPLEGVGVVSITRRGRFRFPPVWPGEYLLHVSRRGYRSRRMKVDLDPGINPPLRVTLREL